DSNPEGWDAVKALEKQLEAKKYSNLSWPLGKGCPGPEVIDLGDQVRLIVVNTAFWAYPHRKPVPSDGLCETVSDEIFFEELEDAIADSENRLVIVAGHHPPFGNGRTAGRIAPWWHFLPLVGSVKAGFDQTVGGKYHIYNPYFQDFNHHYGDIILHGPPIVYLSGHDKASELFELENQLFICSGSISEKSGSPNSNAWFHTGKPGLVVLETGTDFELNYTWMQLEDGKFSPVYDQPLYKRVCINSESDDYTVLDIGKGIGLNNPNSCPDLGSSSFSDGWLNDQANKISPAGAQYEASGFKRAFLGPHYRSTWTAPVNLPILNLDTTYQGLEILKRGGGRQTLSLKMRGGNGQDYVFRSVDKDPSKALSFEYRNTIISKVAKDQTTTQHPYGAIATSSLLDKLDILHAQPKLFFLPEGNLGHFEVPFGGMMGMLEEKPGNHNDNAYLFAQADKIFKSAAMFDKLYNGGNQVELTEYARARAFDIWVGDWGKHEDNWKWAGYKDAGDWTFRPIPRDRDHVFSNWDGILPWLADREWAKPSGEHFNYKIRDIRSLTWQVRHMDRFLASSLDKEAWQAAALEVKSMLTAQDVATAVRAMPIEIQDASGIIIEEKLNARLLNLEEDVEKYYALLAKQVDVLGTKKKDTFLLFGSDDELSVFVYNKKGGKHFHRVFKPSETKEVRLFGLNGDDHFSIKGELPSIKIRIIGGDGSDSLSQLGLGSKPLIYDRDFEFTGKARNIKRANDIAYQYDRTAFVYDTYLPMASIGFNSYSGFSLGAGVSFTKQKFGKPDFWVKQKINASITSMGHYNVGYSLRFREVLAGSDFIFNVHAATPIAQSFYYGFGNEERPLDSVSSFYDAFLETISAKVELEKTFWKYADISIGIAYERTQTRDDIAFGINQDISILGLDVLNNIFGELNVDFDTRDSEIFPRKGSRLQANFKYGSNENDIYSTFTGAMHWYATTRGFPVTFALQVGGAWSNASAWYQLPALGQGSGLRGFRPARFRWDKVAYGNFNVHMPVLTAQNNFIPLTIGISGFADVGRAFGFSTIADNPIANQGQWHLGLGGGIYLIPLSESYTLRLTLGFSAEETALVGFGFGTSF
ncbi:MAG: hypothetical protein ACI959_001466, partial [Limisphaerales bacterium]